MKKTKVFYLVVVLAVSALLLSAANARAVSEEAIRHFNRGAALAMAVAALRMAKSPDEAKSPDDYAAAIKEFEQAIRFAPDWPDVYNSLGMVQEMAGKYRDAITSLKQYLRLAPNASDAALRKSIINELEFKAEQEITEAKRHFDRGMAAVETAKSTEAFKDAIKEFEQAIKLAPDWPAPYYNLGLAQEKAGKYSDAITSLKQYLRLAPNASDAETVKTLINKLEYKRDRSNIEGRWKVDWNELAVQCDIGLYALEKSSFGSPVQVIEDIVLEVRKNTDGMVARVLSSEARTTRMLPDGPYVPVRQDGDMVKIFDAVMNTCLSEVSPDHRPWKAKFVLQQTAANVLQGTIKVWGITDAVLSFSPLTLKTSPIACDGKIILRRVDKVK